MVEDFWGPSVKMVGESDFLRSLQSFDKVDAGDGLGPKKERCGRLANSAVLCKEWHFLPKC